jgi:hypothetical protein
MRPFSDYQQKKKQGIGEDDGFLYSLDPGSGAVVSTPSRTSPRSTYTKVDSTGA